VGKISKALDKYRRERQAESQVSKMRSPIQASENTQVDSQKNTRKIEKDHPRDVKDLIKATNLSESDLAILMSYDRATGHLLKYDKDTGNLDDNSLEIIRDQGVLQRLLKAKMIYPGGKLTPAGIETCVELPPALRNSAADTAILMNFENADRQSGERSEATAKLQASDWAALMQYDRETGNLIKYDSESGKLDERSRAILRNPDAIQRLIDNRMILPGGWLTKEAKQECEKREHGDPKVDSKKKTPIDGREIRMPSSEAQDLVEPLRFPEERPETTPAGISIKQSAAAEEKSKPENKAVKIPRRIDEPNAVDNHLVSLLDPLSFEAEQFKILRTNLLFPVSGQAPRSILVTSTVLGEGKSFIAANLAVSIAQDIDRHVLLVDCDLRKPKVHIQFGFADVPGLSDYLTNGTALQDLLINTKLDKLSILPAGKPPPNPAELVSSEKMSALIEEVTNRYRDRIIIIDSPPPKLTAESSFLARQVDGIILVVSYGKTRRDDVKELIQKLGKHKVLGCIINRFDLRSLGYYGYKKYHQHGHYYSAKRQ
jgi:exopolysaccharide/PEP-CTERM locus tyrosine autokinase